MGMLKWNYIHTMMQMPRLTAQWQELYGRMWDKADVINNMSELLPLITWIEAGN